MNKCFKCGTSESLINHHISYSPPKSVICCRSCHRKIHHRIRKENKCPLSVEKVKEISTKLSLMRPESKKKHKDYILKQKQKNNILLDIEELRKAINNLL